MPRKYISTAEKRREESRRTILNAAIDLFFTKGYEKTTTRDIIVKAGILNGSLYNRFRNKEDILYTIVEEAIVEALERLTDMLENEKNPLVVMNLPIAMEIYLSSRNPRIAELLYEVHRSWNNMNEYVSMYTEWANGHLDKYGISFSDDSGSRMKTIALIGAIGNIAGHYAHGGTADYREVLKQLIGVSCTLFDAHVLDIQKLVDTLSSMVENDELVLLGHRLS